MLAELAMATHDTGNLSHAALLLGAAEGIWDRQGCSETARAALSSWNGELLLLRDAMSDPAFAETIEKGRNLSIEAAYDEAMALPLTVSYPLRLSSVLSPRALELLALVQQGLTNREIADALFVSKRTIDDHLLRIYSTLGVNSRRAAVRTAADRGILPT